ncbi:MAG: DHH family phosphoesterase, partial [Lachnospiraceae bacterium]|nr:DHH family phosphoesterase [Lachnospiraceae bacterium]
IIADYYRDLNITPSTDVATALLYGIKIDTLQFSRGVAAEDIIAFGMLNPIVDVVKMGKLEMNNLEFSDLKAYGAAIENIKVFDYFGFTHIPFACPDAMIAIVADFILSLIEIEVAVIYCDRPDGMKLSVRSERDDINAGELMAKALDGIGSGGGHATMAGGRIPAANIPLLGEYKDDFLAERFIKAMGMKF